MRIIISRNSPRLSDLSADESSLVALMKATSICAGSMTNLSPVLFEYCVVMSNTPCYKLGKPISGYFLEFARMSMYIVWMASKFSLRIFSHFLISSGSFRNLSGQKLSLNVLPPSSLNGEVSRSYAISNL